MTPIEVAIVVCFALLYALATVANLALSRIEASQLYAPIPMVLACPLCGAPHVDEGEWAHRAHRTHLCAVCTFEWRPANVATVGVEVLPPLSQSNHAARKATP